MDFYTNKKNALKLIEKLVFGDKTGVKNGETGVKNGILLNDIYLIILKNYGFSKVFVDKYLKILNEKGCVFFKNGRVFSTDTPIFADNNLIFDDSNLISQAQECKKED